MKTVSALVVAVTLLFARPAAAGIPVIDGSNLVQNILTAARTLQQINNQIRQLQNEAVMLTNQARNLTSLDFNTLNRMRVALASTNRLIAEAQGLAYEVSRMESEFSRLYPVEYAGSISGSRMALDARQRWRYSLDALRTTAKMQAQVAQNFPVDESTLADLVARSQSAVGQLQATQATNQLLALQSRQAIQEQQLRITQDRAVALEQARQVAVQERAREVRRRFQGAGTPYTPYTVSYY